MKRSATPSRKSMKRSRLNPRSAKREQEMTVRREVVAMLRATTTECEGHRLLTEAMRLAVAEGHFDVAEVFQVALRRCRRWEPCEPHEPLKRSRGGPVTVAEAIMMLCSPCHAFTESEVRAATLAGMLTPSWERNQ